MALDPRISLAANAGDLSRIIPSALQTFAMAQQAAQQAEEAPIRQELLNLQLDQARAAQPTELQQFEAAQDQRLGSIAKFAQSVLPDLQAGNFDSVKTALENRFRALDEQGINTDDTVEAIDTFNRDPQAFLQDAQQAVQLAKQRGLIQAPTGIQSSAFIPGVGFATLSKTGEAGVVPIAGAGETAQQKRLADIEKQKEVEKLKGEQSIKTEQEKAKIELQTAASKEEQKQLGKTRADIATKIKAGARDGRKTLREVGRMKDALAKLSTGRLAQAQQSIGSLIPGIRDADAETFNSMVNQFILARKDELLGGGILSDADIALLQTVGPQLGNTAEANLNILNTFEQVANDAIDRGSRFAEFKGNAEDFELDLAKEPIQQQETLQPINVGRFQVEVAE